MDERERRGIFRNLTSYGDPGLSRFLRRAFLRSAGLDAADLGRPVVGICDTSSDFNTCHRGMAELVSAVKRGVLQAGGLPLAFPASSWNEILTSPTTMLYRNLLAMEVEELVRAQPMDAVVLLGGCDKTVPAQLMAAISVDLPAISVVTGPMRTGLWRGERLGACTDCRRYYAAHRAGQLTEEELGEVEARLCATAGSCPVMGTASTMACVTEALGMMLPGGATAPAASGDRLQHAVAAGRRAVALAEGGGPRPRELLRPEAFRNALRVLVALGGSTNVVVHLFALAGRAGVPLGYADLEEASRAVPLLVDCKPAGSGYLEDLHAAGGVPALLKALEPLLETRVAGEAGAAHLVDVSGEPMAARLALTAPPGAWQTTLRSLESPLGPVGSLRVLRGSLAPEGALLKAAAASPSLFRHTGPAVVFDSPEDVARRIDDPALGLTPDHVLVLRNAGPVGAGFPEAGSLPIPRSLGSLGVKDMVRISDARMSGTAYGTIVLHCAPEAAVGGPLSLVADGDPIGLDVEAGALELLVPEEELARRRAAWRPPPRPGRGWARLYADHVLGAERGADLDFLLPGG
ncbi:MAG: dihydroxy-acid dehydratase [Polyangia bacterium]|jgi:dihydroxy-acid dehydratase|nr:dihydroxy-acid dehydratase [Polyangia bacterium]